MLDRLQAESFWEFLPDLEVITYGVRTPATAPDAADGFTTFTLNHVRRREATRAELAAAGAALGDEFLVFMVWQDDLDFQVCTGAQPYASYQLTDGDGVAWNIENAKRHQTYARWDCLCRKAR